jgi:hypothetical protein
MIISLFCRIVFSKLNIYFEEKRHISIEHLLQSSKWTVGSYFTSDFQKRFLPIATDDNQKALLCNNILVQFTDTSHLNPRLGVVSIPLTGIILS